MQQGENAKRAIGRDEVEIGHAAPEERMPFTEIVVNTQTGQLAGQAPARLVHGEEFGDGIAQGFAAVVRAAKRDLRHGVAQHAGSDRVALGVIRIEEIFR